MRHRRRDDSKYAQPALPFSSGTEIRVLGSRQLSSERGDRMVAASIWEHSTVDLAQMQRSHAGLFQDG